MFKKILGLEIKNFFNYNLDNLNLNEDVPIRKNQFEILNQISTINISLRPKKEPILIINKIHSMVVLKKEKEKQKQKINNVNNFEIVNTIKNQVLEIEKNSSSVEILNGDQKNKKYSISNLNNIEILNNYNQNQTIYSDRGELMVRAKIIMFNIKSDDRDKGRFHEYSGYKRRSRKWDELNIENSVINFEIKKTVKNIDLFMNSKINIEILGKKNMISNKKLYVIENQEDILLKNKLNNNIFKPKKMEIIKDKNIGKIITKSPEIELKNNNKKYDNLKTKSPNTIKINQAFPFLPASNNNLFTDNDFKHNKNSEFVNIDIIQLEKQYENIKKEFNVLYPVISKNKEYRENFFFNLAGKKRGKYNFYLSLYKIIKDEYEEKNNNALNNYTKLKKIFDGKKSSKNKLKPIKKNYSTTHIMAKNKAVATDGNFN